ncbi:MAG: nuclear transport factor 2 family protein [Burkholderiaceae bacterium]|nr:nuclear transport factor 2 family protein [Burkholderiaceae bacterium]
MPEPAPRHGDPRVQAVIALFEGLTPADLPALRGVYADDASFKDPFNEVQGLAAIAAIFEHMFRQLDDPRFTVRELVAEGDALFLTWDFDFRRRGAGAMRIHGASHLRFDAGGRVAMHRDYWDAAEELYEKLPLVGALMRWLKRQAAG